MIPYGKQEITESDINAVIDALKSPLITQGPKAQEFEEKIASKVGAQFGVSFNSATSALHCAALALGLGKGDFLWTTPNSFVASANCGIYCGAKVDFVDIDAQTYNLDTKALEKKLKNTPKRKLPKVLVAAFCRTKLRDERNLSLKSNLPLQNHRRRFTRTWWKLL